MSGVWVVYDFDGPAYPIAFFAEEIDAHRYRNEIGYGGVQFVHFGMTWNAAFRDVTSRPVLGKR